MPIYEYRCENGHQFDVMQKFSDEALTTCQECGAPARRVLSAPAVHFKGSGFYNTDYGTKRRRREMDAQGSSGSSSSGGSEGGASSSGSGSDAGSSGGASSEGSSSSSGGSGSGSGSGGSGSGGGSSSGSAGSPAP